MSDCLEETVDVLVEKIRLLQARVTELERWPDTGEMMDNSSAEHLLAGWRSRCLAAEHTNQRLLAELADLRRKYIEQCGTVEEWSVR